MDTSKQARIPMKADTELPRPTFRIFDDRTLALILFLLVLGIGLSLCAAAYAQAAASTVTVEGVGAMEVTHLTAAVEAVDVANRVVTLKGPGGRVFSVSVSPAVKAFPRVKVGDTVAADYYEAIAIEAKPTEGTPSLSATGAVGRAGPGGKPAGVALRRVHAVTTVLGVNTDNGSVLIRGPLGHLAEVKVNDAKTLASLKNGGQVDITYVEGLALSLRPAKGA